MSPPEPQDPKTKARGFLRGLGEVAEFLRESAIAVLEVVTGKGPKPDEDTPPKLKPKAPNQGKGPIEKISPFPFDD